MEWLFTMIHRTRIPISKTTNKIPGRLFRSNLGYQHAVKNPTQDWYQLGPVRALTKKKITCGRRLVVYLFVMRVCACFTFFFLPFFCRARGLDLFSRFIPQLYHKPVTLGMTWLVWTMRRTITRQTVFTSPSWCRSWLQISPQILGTTVYHYN